MMVCGAGMYAQAQVLKPGVGLNFTDFTTYSSDASAKAGWQIGASMEFGDKLYFETGLYYGCKSLEYSDPNNATQDDFNSSSYRVFAGAGVDFSILFVEAAYEWSVTDLSDVSTIDVGKTRGLFATAGLRFRL
tara:strand:+ start:11773 stop:12171 length:399 start_codon:yes stop_codon:yes gene_type:complete